jgi:nitrate/nitrite transport system substrate-binding protein
MQFFKTYEHTTDSVRPVDKHSLFRSLAADIAASAILLSRSFSVYAETEGLEKEVLKFGFIKLTDMAPLAIAYEKGYF